MGPLRQKKGQSGSQKISGRSFGAGTSTLTIAESDLKVVTTANPAARNCGICLFCWKVAKHLSRTLLSSRVAAAPRVGLKPMSRGDSVKIAVLKINRSHWQAALRFGCFFPVSGRVEEAGLRWLRRPSSSRAVQYASRGSHCSRRSTGMAIIFTGVPALFAISRRLRARCIVI